MNKSFFRKIALLCLSCISLSCSISTTYAQTISYGDSWKYSDTGIDPGVNWNTSAFSDASWPSGNGEFGFGEGDESQVLASGNLVYYLRKNVTISDASSVISAEFNFIRDDGVLIYLNGIEVGRSNMPIGPVTNMTAANSNITGASESSIQTLNIPTNMFLDGNNLIAVSLHNRSSNNADLSFDLEMNLDIQTCNGPPAGLTSFASFNEVTISWTADPNAAYYDVRYRILGTSAWTSTNVIDDAVIIDGLSLCESYEYQVASFCGAFTAYSNSNFFNSECNTAAGNAIISADSDWKYYQQGNEPSGSWENEPFIDSAWPSGAGELGFGDGDESTLLNSGLITYYFRKNFHMDNLTDYPSYTLRYKRDDGIILYLNGVEIIRENMPSGSVSYSTLASGPVGNEDAWIELVLSPSQFSVGDNVITAEVHQRDLTSSDVSFNLSLEGTLLEVVRGPYLQQGSHDRMTVKWRTSGLANSIVKYGTSQGNLNLTASDMALKSNHELVITGLNPNTKYYYEIYNDSNVLYAGSSDLYFQTYPLAGSQQSFTTWVLGDCGTANNNARAVRDKMYDYLGNNHLDMMLFLGDNAYNDGTDTQYQYSLFENMYEDRLKNTVSWSCLGNHDGYTANSNQQTGPYYEIFDFPTNGECGGVPSGTEAYYSFNHGNTHYIVLDSYETDRAIGSPMYNWAAMDIQNATATWIVALWHHPPYTKGTHNSDTEGPLIQMRENFLPMLESNGVDLVLSGHSHGYERSYLLNGHYGNSSSILDSHFLDKCSGKEDVDGAYIIENSGPNEDEGTVYIVTGNAGREGNGQYNHPAMYISEKIMGSLVIETTGDEMYLQHIDIFGNIHDYFTIRKGPISDCVTAPTGLDVTFDSANNELDLTWNAINATAEYAIRYRKVGDSEWSEESINVNSASLSGSDIDCNENYEFQVNTICDCRYSEWSASALSNSFSSCIECGTVASSNVSNISGSSAFLSWSPAVAAVSYTIRYKETGEAIWQSLNASSLNVNIQNLETCGFYDYEIIPSCGFGLTSAATTGVFNTACCPLTVSGFNTTDVSMNQGTVSWNASPGAASYQMDFKPSNSNTWNTITLSEPTFTFNSLVICESYDIRIRIMCSSGVLSDDSPIYTFSAECNQCAEPSGISALNVGETFAILNWNPVAGANNYIANYREVGTNTWIPISVSTASLSISTLSACKTYEIYVTSECGVGEVSDPSQIVNFATICCNTAPSGLTVSSIDLDQAVISWIPITGALSYQLEYKLATASTWQTISGVSNSASLVALNLCTLYNTRVRAVCAGGSVSAYSATTNFTSGCINVPCQIPSGLSVISDSAVSSQLSWNSDATAVSYALYYKKNSDLVWDTITLTSSILSYVISDLDPCATYQYAISSSCQLGMNSGLSAVISETQYCCDVMTNAPSILSVENFSVSLIYDSFSSVSSYIVQYRIVGDPVWTTSSTTNSFISFNVSDPCETYEARVATVCNLDSTAFSNTLLFTGDCCNAPLGLNIIPNIDQLNAVISWPPVSDAEVYILEYRESSQYIWNAVSYNSTTAFLISLEECTEYDVRVSSSCELFPSVQNYSPISTFNTGTCNDVCDAAQGLYSFNKTANSAIITWDLLVGASSYTVRYRELGSNSWSPTFTTGYPLIVLNSLLPCRFYEYQLQLVCQNGISSDFSVSHVFNTVGCKNEGEAESKDATALSNIILYPNPTDGIVNISGIKDFTDINMTWYNSEGRRVEPQISDGIVDLSELIDGVYITVIKNGSSLVTRKVSLFRD